MTGQYSHRQFFRQTPNALLQRYFEHKSIMLILLRLMKMTVIRYLMP
jgi:hypothetical protein